MSNPCLFLPEKRHLRPAQLRVSCLENHSVTLSASVRHQLFSLFSPTAFHQDASRRSCSPDVTEAGTLVPVFGWGPPSVATATVRSLTVLYAHIQGFRWPICLDSRAVWEGEIDRRHRSSGTKCLWRLSGVWYAGLRAAV